jgi:hypothetical protein
MSQPNYDRPPVPAKDDVFRAAIGQIEKSTESASVLLQSVDISDAPINRDTADPTPVLDESGESLFSVYLSLPDKGDQIQSPTAMYDDESKSIQNAPSLNLSRPSSLARSVEVALSQLNFDFDSIDMQRGRKPSDASSYHSQNSISSLMQDSPGIPNAALLSPIQENQVARPAPVSRSKRLQKPLPLPKDDKYEKRPRSEIKSKLNDYNRSKTQAKSQRKIGTESTVNPVLPATSASKGAKANQKALPTTKSTSESSRQMFPPQANPSPNLMRSVSTKQPSRRPKLYADHSGSQILRRSKTFVDRSREKYDAIPSATLLAPSKNGDSNRLRALANPVEEQRKLDFKADKPRIIVPVPTSVSDQQSVRRTPSNLRSKNSSQKNRAESSILKTPSLRTKQRPYSVQPSPVSPPLTPPQRMQSRTPPPPPRTRFPSGSVPAPVIIPPRSSSSSTPCLRIKCYYGSTAVTIGLGWDDPALVAALTPTSPLEPTNNAVQTVIKKLKERFDLIGVHIDKQTKNKLVYQDEEEDYISVLSDEDLKVAVESRGRTEGRLVFWLDSPSFPNRA